MAYEYFQIPGTRTILHTDPELERGRIELFKPLLRRHGKLFPHRPYNGEYKVMNKNGRCFDQAMMLAKKMGLTYVEGFMIFHYPGGMLPIGHGWCADKQGFVVDPTCWAMTGREDLQYVGIPIKTAYSDDWKTLTGYYGCMDGYFDGEQVHTEVGIYADDPAEWLETVPS